MRKTKTTRRVRNPLPKLPKNTPWLKPRRAPKGSPFAPGPVRRIRRRP